jgi:hypothetical protein
MKAVDYNGALGRRFFAMRRYSLSISMTKYRISILFENHADNHMGAPHGF